MSDLKIQGLVKKLDLSLTLKRQAVGIKLIPTEAEFNKINDRGIKILRNKITYCNLVRLASSGYSFKCGIDGCACMSAARALGMVEATAQWESGEFYSEKKMYCNVDISKKVVDNTTNLKPGNFGVLVRPLSDFTEVPDVVIIITNPYNMMRLIQGYTYYYGTYSNYRVIGNQAFCVECTSYPLVSGNINVSFLCAGTRYNAGWGDDEQAMGLPFDKFENTVSGLFETINTMENDRNKKNIIEKLKVNDIDLKIKLKDNYFTGLYLK